ncbi:uncharacterized protein LOC110466259 [Mizuhopecten yessoensis]|uniref:Uncharacterized protein n=1 Tax=Mizuhopecten yessoensis TaxID=6573 RepID=A0A210R1S5_MIZYE|nr:uncharacterized protein LOC110466259 [Mizuhopecten yessoensis]OWF54932.1 hypothetical protein KP79_PYT00271 [Mizuhopecten yessoensis]
MFPKIVNKSFFDTKVQDQFRRQLSTMTGGRGDMIGLGLSDEEKQEDETSEGEATKENGEKKSKKRDKSKKQEQPIKPPFNFDLAEFLADYFSKEKTTKNSDNRSQQQTTTWKNRRKQRKGKHCTGYEI